MHLHYLRELTDRFQIAALCDLSRTVVDRVGEAYGVDRRFTDWTQQLVASSKERLLISGGFAGVYAFKVRTGEKVWSYRLCDGANSRSSDHSQVCVAVDAATISEWRASLPDLSRRA